MPQDFQEAVWMPSTHYWKGHNGLAPAFIIVHGTAGGNDARAMTTWMETQTEREQTSVHYVVDQKGVVVQQVSEADAAWGNGVLTTGHESFWDHIGTPNPNWRTFSIEHVKSHADNSDTLTAAQQSASFRLIADICRRHNIPRRKADAAGGITGHYSIDPVNRKYCPGPYPWDALFAYLNMQPTTQTPVIGGDTAMSFPAGIPTGWHDDGKTLTAPNGQVVVLGFRTQVLKGWDPLNVPQSAEGGANPANPLDAHSGSGTIQYFRDSILCWTAATNTVFAVPAGQLAFSIKSASSATSTAAAPTSAADAAKQTAKKKALESVVAKVEGELDASEAELKAAVVAAEAA